MVKSEDVGEDEAVDDDVAAPLLLSLVIGDAMLLFKTADILSWLTNEARQSCLPDEAACLVGCAVACDSANASRRHILFVHQDQSIAR